MLAMVTLSRDYNMAPNNLNKMIERSGLTNKMVAELKGIQPATLSRHKSGDIGISLADAEEYAAILKCEPQQIFFSNPPIPILATVQNVETAHCKVDLKSLTDISLVLCQHLNKDGRKKFHNKSIYLHGYYNHSTMCVVWDLDSNIEHKANWQHGNLDIVNADPIWHKYVDKNALGGHYCIAMTDNGRLLYGELYQTGRNKYNINSWNFGTYENLKLKWATPIVDMVIRPELKQVEFKDTDNEAWAKKMQAT